MKTDYAHLPLHTRKSLIELEIKKANEMKNIFCNYKLSEVRFEGNGQSIRVPLSLINQHSVRGMAINNANKRISKLKKELKLVNFEMQLAKKHSLIPTGQSTTQ